MVIVSLTSSRGHGSPFTNSIPPKLIVTRNTCTRPQSGCLMILMNGAKQLTPFMGAKSPCLDALLKTARASVPIVSATTCTKSSLHNKITILLFGLTRLKFQGSHSNDVSKFKDFFSTFQHHEHQKIRPTVLLTTFYVVLVRKHGSENVT